MSAQQPLASSRGHRSIVIGRSAGSGPEPGSWPPPDSSGDDHDVRAAPGAPAAAHAARIGRAHAPRRSAARRPRSSPRRARRAADQPPRRPPCRPRPRAARGGCPSSSAALLTRRRALDRAVVDGERRRPPSRSRSATATGRSPGTTRRADAPRARARGPPSRSSAPRRAASRLEQLEEAELLARAAAPAPGSASRSRAPSSALVSTSDAPSRATNRNGSTISSGDLVPDRGVADGVAVEDDRRH